MKCPICENEKFIKINELKKTNDPNLDMYACTKCGYVFMIEKDVKGIYQAYSMKAKRLEKIIKEKIEEHELLTDFEGSNKKLALDKKVKADQLYNEISELIDEYTQISEKIYFDKNI